jgi:4-aminobutyrate aminotransferase/(S)-3-amino-2-methylpropionate transaminase
MIAFDILDQSGAPDGPAAKEVCARALHEGLIVLTCGQSGQAIRILVPLTVSDEILDEGLEALERALLPAIASSSNATLARTEAAA